MVDRTAAGRPLVGIGFVVLATLAFGLADVVTKHLSILYPVPVDVAVRYRGGRRPHTAATH